MTPRQITEIARFFHAFSEPSRLVLLKTLMDGEKTVTSLAEETGINQPNVSKQLAILATARLVERKRDGNCICYYICEPLVHEICRAVCGKLQRDAKEWGIDNDEASMF